MKILITGADIAAETSSLLDVSNLAAFRLCAGAAKPDIIINCAAFTDVDACEGDPDTAMRTNALGARNAAIAAEESGAKLVHVSTDYVFPGDASEPYREWDECAPNSVYGSSKLLGERYVRDFCSRYFIVRTSWSFGYGGRNFVKAILNAARGRETLKVVDDQKGNPSSVLDLARHILLIAATEGYGIYHCSGNGVCSRYEFALEILRLSGLGCKAEPCSTTDFPRPAKRPAYSALDNAMLRLTVGDGMSDWRVSLKQFMKHYNRESEALLP